MVVSGSFDGTSVSPPIVKSAPIKPHEGGEHLPFIALLAAALAGAVPDFVAGLRCDAVVNLSSVNTY
jgi:hypothetical protein